MPRILLTAARCEPYSMKDNQTGKEITGMSGRIHGVKCKPEGKQGIAGQATVAMACEAPIATHLRDELLRLKRPLIVQIDIDVKGSGANMKQNCIDAEIVGAYDPAKWDWTDAGLLPRAARVNPTQSAPSQPETARTAAVA